MLSSKLYYAPWEGLLMDLIQQFIDTYKMKWTFYDAAGRLAAEKLQLALQNAPGFDCAAENADAGGSG